MEDEVSYVVSIRLLGREVWWTGEGWDTSFARAKLLTGRAAVTLADGEEDRQGQIYASLADGLHCIGDW